MRTDVQKGIDCGNRIRQTNHKLAHCADGRLRPLPNYILDVPERKWVLIRPTGRHEN